MDLNESNIIYSTYNSVSHGPIMEREKARAAKPTLCRCSRRGF
jgi:hypothetical protein